MSTHTPGPWAQSENDVLATFDLATQTVSDVNGDEPVAECFGPDAYANARLIASAPELLEALESIVDDMKARWDMNDPRTNPGIRNNVERAELALAKAR